MIGGWTQAQAVAFCCDVEAIAATQGWHVALTGGTLYKAGERKDADVMFYRVRQARLEGDELHAAAEVLLNTLASSLCLQRTTDHWWVRKAIDGAGRHIDFFFPELPENEWSTYGSAAENAVDNFEDFA